LVVRKRKAYNPNHLRHAHSVVTQQGKLLSPLKNCRQLQTRKEVASIAENITKSVNVGNWAPSMAHKKLPGFSHSDTSL